MTELIDTKDRRILHQLDLNCRQSHTQIGKKVGLSKNVVQYRIKELENKQVIQSYYPVINVAKLGYMYTRFFFNFQSVTKEKYEKIVKDFMKLPHLIWLGSGEGEWEFIAVFLLKNVQEIDAMYQDIMDKHCESIAEMDINPLTRFHVNVQDYAFIGDNSQYETMDGIDASDDLDEYDMKIIECLKHNAKIQIIDLAEEVGLTAKTIASRIKSLVSNKFILGFRCQLNHKLLGFDYYHVGFKLQHVDRTKKAQIIEYLKSIKNMFYIDETFGKYAIECEIMEQSQNDLHETVMKIKDKFPGMIREHSVSLTYQVYKA